MKLFSYPSFRFFNWQKIKQEEPAEVADAIVLEFTPTGQIRAGQLEVKILLQVIPPDSRKYIAEVKEFLSEPDQKTLRTGQHVRIFFKAKNPARVYWMEKKTNGM